MVTKKTAKSVKKSTGKKPNSKTTTVKAVISTKKLSIFGASLTTKPITKALIAELIGTFLLTTAVIAGQGQPIIIMFAIVGIVLFFGTISGAHFNPAITFAAWVTKRISGLRTLGYVVTQFVGAGLAFALLNTYVNGAAPVSAEAQAYGQAAASLFHANLLTDGKEWFIFFSELIGASILGYAIATALRFKKDRVAAAFTVGFGIFVALLLAASAAAYLGGSAILNPAIALSLQVINWKEWWTIWPIAVYVLAPAIGAVLGFVLHDIVKNEDNQ